ncbi:hypothetical protein MMSP_1798 [Mycobacterium sp. 012931]|nr:hypothetical protein MMSP_1798 [Mycobacterium sp. 012931]
MHVRDRPKARQAAPIPGLAGVALRDAPAAIQPDCLVPIRGPFGAELAGHAHSSPHRARLHPKPSG